MICQLGLRSIITFDVGGLQVCGSRLAKPYGKKCAPYGEERQLKRAAIMDRQSVKTTEIAQAVGYDGSKLVKGHKRHHSG